MADIVQATGKAVVAHGYDQFTTKHVADMAGVSVGSLYQYFESKEDLIDALLEQVNANLARKLRKLIVNGSPDLAVMVRLAVDFGFEFLQEDDGLGVELVRNWYKLPTQKFVTVLQNTLLDFMRMYLLKNQLPSSLQRLHVRSFVVANSMVFSIIRAVSEPSPFITEEDLKEELTVMVMQYLAAP